MATNNKKTSSSTIAKNKKARFNFAIEEQLQAGLSLEGWEVKSLRANKAQLTESYVIIKKNEAWLIGSNITPLQSASNIENSDSSRTRKILLHRKEIDRFKGLIDRKGYTLVALDLHWGNGKAKINIGLAKGKKQHDKRQASKDRDWERRKARTIKSFNKH
ncbi:MAG: SsrA-binding protein [Gammaproteobacteria bacterium TMED78]|nr:MAG: SsrA-binding protein [Gammaproteobacteria bacterium TMED78]|tara:strand:- start:18480 stop:18962 length:483 start_codon:yes stop_codon:yes gene_type:complete